MSHLYDGARRSYIAVHHRGGCGAEGDPASLDCYCRKINECTTAPCTGNYKHFYDFCISRSGDINTSWDFGCLSYPFYRNSTGGATCGANCNCAQTTAVMMQRCYGGSGCNSPCPLPGFTDPQLCSLAYISLHLSTFGGVVNEYNHISHRKAGSWRPCDGGGCGVGECAGCPTGCATECCGTNLATDSTPSGWTGEGLYEMNRMFWMRYNLSIGCNCTGEICA